MPTLPNKIDSNVTGLRYAEESSIKLITGETTPGDGAAAGTWYPLEPNSYADFGGSITTVARNPINASRQQKKGVVTDLESTGGFNMDLTASNLEDMLQGFLFATVRAKSSAAVAVVGVAADTIEVSSGDGVMFEAGAIILCAGFASSNHNGQFTVTARAGDVLTVAEDLVSDQGSPTGTVELVGFQAVTNADLAMIASGDLHGLSVAAGDLDFSSLGLVVGEWVYVTGFTTAAANGFKRISVITASLITFDKSQLDIANDAATTEQVTVYFGRVIKNESDPSLIVRRSYQLERTLGSHDADVSTKVQAEYVRGAIPNEFTLNMPQAEKINVDLSFIASDMEFLQATSALDLKGGTGQGSGSRPALVEADAFNTSNDVARIRMAVFQDDDEAPTDLFAYVQEMNLTINNNVTQNKAIGVLGSFDSTAGRFQVSGSLTAYFSSTTAIAEVQNNANITVDSVLVKANKGIVVDLPLITLGDGRPNVEQDQAITLPLELDAATGALVNANMDHTMLVQFFPVLPDAAETVI